MSVWLWETVVCRSVGEDVHAKNDQ
jgi:hypothetical protein